MRVLSLAQGTPEWIAARLQHFTASEAPAMLGLSKYQTRNDLLRQKKTGIAPDVDAGTQRLFDRGHEVEALARPIAEGIAGDEFFPVTASETIEGLPLLASFDGITFDESTLFEHKLFNAGLADFITDSCDLPDTHWPQAEHQLLVSGATRCLFMTSDGTENNYAWIWYESKPERRAQLIAGWKQFAIDLEAYQPEAIKAEPAKAAVETLPAVFVQVQGSLVCENNISKFAEQMAAFIKRVPDAPQTDDDFAVCEAAVKTLGNAEDALKAAKDSSLGAIQSLADLHRLIDSQAEIARSNRLRLEKLVKAEKENRKLAIVQAASAALKTWINELNDALGRDYMPAMTADFAGAIKGLRTISSIQNAVDTELANAKIAANEAFQRISKNLTSLRELAAGYAFLFSDTAQLVQKDNEFVVLTINSRIAEHKAAEEKRLEAERERIRAEEAARAEREAQAKLQEEQRLAAAAPVAPEEKPDEPAKQERHALHVVEASNDTGERITLGQINTRLAPIQLSVDGLRTLGFEPVATERAAKLYRAADFGRICDALIEHIQAAELRKAA